MLWNKSLAQVSALLLLAVSSSFGCWSCKENVDPKQSAFTFDSLSFQVKRSVPAFENQDKPSLDLSVSIATVTAGANDELVALANNFIADMLVGYGAAKTDQMGGNIESLIETHVAHYKGWVSEEMDNYKNDSEAASRWLSSEFSLSGSAVFNRQGILTYGITKYENSGSWHGQTDYNYNSCTFVYLPESDEYVCQPISLDDIVMPDSIGTLNALLVERVVAHFGAASLDQLRSEGPLFENAEVTAVDNFYISESGVTFVYNMYDIAPYAAGTIELSATWQELLPLMPAESPLLVVANPS